MLTFLNGKFLPEAEARISIFDRGFLLGDGLFETIRVAGGKPFRCAQHLDRLARGAEFIKIKLPFSTRELEKFAVELIAENNLTEAVLRVTLSRGVGPRGYSIQNATQPTLAMTLAPLPPENPDEPSQWSLLTSPFHLAVGDPLSSFKTSGKLLHVLARADAEERGADEALLLNANGEVTETSGGNIFWVYQEKICTAPSGRGALPGITRAVVLEICQSLGLQTSKCVIKPESLHRAEGIFVTQSVLGIVPVAAFDGRPVAPSPLVATIIAAYEKILGGE